MSEIVKPRIVNPRTFGVIAAFIFALTLVSVPVASAQDTAQTAPPGPLAARLNGAKSVFISNAKGENTANEKPRNDQAGTDFYAAMESWNRYRLASAATEADLLMQIDMDKSQVRLTILDPTTRTVLASFVEPVLGGFLISTREKNIKQSISTLVADLRRLTIERAAPLPPAAIPARATTAITAHVSGDQRPRVFISNIGSDDVQFSGIGMASAYGWGQGFNKFYAAVQNSGQYELVGSPADAAFVFEMSYTDPVETATRSQSKPGSDTYPPEQEEVEYTIDHPQVRLVIRDSGTLAVQGAFTELIKVGKKQADRDRAFSAAINALVDDASIRLGHPPATHFMPRVINVAPTPAQIQSAKMVFIANAGGSGMFGGTPSIDQAYNEFYAVMQSWGGYQLSPTTAGADLIFEISANSGFHLAILDPQTNVTLWGFTSEVKIVILKSNAQKNFDRMLVALVEDIGSLADRPVAAISIPQDIKAAPIPPQIASAKTVFIANGGEETLTDIKGTTTYRAYSDFYATMKTWGRYELAPTPSQADLVLQISLTGANIHLAILDSKTQASLWELKQNIHGVFRHTGQHDDCDKAIAALVKSTARLAGQPAAEISVPAGLNTAPVPSKISDSRKIFLSRPVNDSDFFEQQAPDQFYSQCSTAMKSLGKYQPTTTPAEADLIFEPSVYGNRVRLTIRDAKTRHVLWAFTQPVKIAFLNSNAKKNYIAAIGLLMDDLHRMAALNVESSGDITAKREKAATAQQK